MFDYQLKALEKFKKLRVAALFMEMGTGKTRTAKELARQVQDKIDAVLWLAPKSTINNLKKELDQTDQLNVPIYTMGYETIASSDKTYLEMLEKMNDYRKNNGLRIFLVCDESLYVKNGETKRWRRVNHIRQEFADYVCLLNGTPMTRDEMDIYWQMAILSPKIIGLSENQYKNTMFTKFINKATGAVWYKSCTKNVAWLRSRIAPYVYECDLNIPIRLIEDNISIAPSEWVKDRYRERKRELLRKVKEQVSTDSIIEGLTALKSIASNDWYKNTVIGEQITDMGKRCLVFCCYRTEQEQLSKKIKNGYYLINGDTPSDERKQIIEEWENNEKPLLITFGCGAFGLNLQATDTIIMASLPWDYGQYNQAIHRAYRTGQSSSEVKVIRYKTRLGISNLVDDCLWRKMTLADVIKHTDWESQI